jgi:uncharacterized protein with PQ loop repeat
MYSDEIMKNINKIALSILFEVILALIFFYIGGILNKIISEEVPLIIYAIIGGIVGSIPLFIYWKFFEKN